MSSIKLVCFDLNKTLIKENTWYDLNLAMGVTPEEDRKLLELYDSGRLDYVSWQKELESIYIQRNKAHRDEIIRIVSTYSYREGAKEIVRYLQEKGYEIVLLSGSIDIQVEQVAKELNIQYFAANNTFVFNEKGYVKNIVCYGDDREFKLQKLREVCKKLNIQTKECVCIGDGDNDVLIFDETLHGITFQNSIIKSKVWKRINTFDDIRSIL